MPWVIPVVGGPFCGWDRRFAVLVTVPPYFVVTQEDERRAYRYNIASRHRDHVLILHYEGEVTDEVCG